MKEPCPENTVSACTAETSVLQNTAIAAQAQKRKREVHTFLFSLAKRRLRGHLMATFQYLKGATRKIELFDRAHCNKTRDSIQNSYKEEIFYIECDEILA